MEGIPTSFSLKEPFLEIITLLGNNYLNPICFFDSVIYLRNYLIDQSEVTDIVNQLFIAYKEYDFVEKENFLNEIQYLKKSEDKTD
ncbi:hypothetical protein BpHYR1_046263 [Brachionus plicatilis]|uniref:Uncharacterized protein n=1 Tax=Brachionus plicatilis TaxID=10195 RepID=A0A3M7S5L0_BRAPC|nr:hypothetical protein BpHYR1_046263 [Brachionus plicatilis]